MPNRINNRSNESPIARMEENLVERMSRSRARAQRIRRGATIAGGLLAAASVTGGTLAVLASQEERDYWVYCYAAPATDATYTQASVAEAIDPQTGAPMKRADIDAEEICSRMWSGGVIGQAEPPEDPNNHQYPVPALQVCVRKDGVRAVFPSKDPEICTDLGLRRHK